MSCTICYSNILLNLYKSMLCTICYSHTLLNLFLCMLSIILIYSKRCCSCKELVNYMYVYLEIIFLIKTDLFRAYFEPIPYYL